MIHDIQERPLGSPLLIRVLHRLERVTGAAGILALVKWNDAQPNFGTIRAAILAAMKGPK